MSRATPENKWIAKNQRRVDVATAAVDEFLALRRSLILQTGKKYQDTLGEMRNRRNVVLATIDELERISTPSASAVNNNRRNYFTRSVEVLKEEVTKMEHYLEHPFPMYAIFNGFKTAVSYLFAALWYIPSRIINWVKGNSSQDPQRPRPSSAELTRMTRETEEEVRSVEEEQRTFHENMEEALISGQDRDRISRSRSTRANVRQRGSRSASLSRQRSAQPPARSTVNPAARRHSVALLV